MDVPKGKDVPAPQQFHSTGSSSSGVAPLGSWRFKGDDELLELGAKRKCTKYKCIDPRCTDTWCNNSCNRNPSYCPSGFCKCSSSNPPPPTPPPPVARRRRTTAPTRSPTPTPRTIPLCNEKCTWSTHSNKVYYNKVFGDVCCATCKEHQKINVLMPT